MSVSYRHFHIDTESRLQKVVPNLAYVMREPHMNVPPSFVGMKARVALALLSSMMAYVIPATCAGQPNRDHQAVVQSTVTAWLPTGNLSVARASHTATLLPNGKVLAVGGFGGDPYPLDSAELYDPATGTWSATGHLNVAKAGHTATLLPNGQVLVVGQTNIRTDVNRESPQSNADSAELYDPDTGTWTLTSPGAGYWNGHTATLLRSGKILFAAGAGSPYGDYHFSSATAAALYDSATGSWSVNTGRLISPRLGAHQATLLEDGRVLVTGGTYDTDLSYGLLNAEFYNPVADAWSGAPDLRVPRYGHTATRLLDGRVLVAGGDSLQEGSTLSFPANNTAELFDPGIGNWITVGGLSTGRSGHTATLLSNGEVLVAGGYTFTPPNSGVYNKKAERYDPGSALWHETSDLNEARSGHTATLLPSGKVLIAGGWTPSGVLNSAELYNPVPSGTIVPAFTGSWFDPSQNGHGLLVEVLPNMQFLAAWFAFNLAGTQQAWFVGVGTYTGNTATIANVIQPSGGRWIPNFDAGDVVKHPWGTLKFTFADCNHGKVEFASSAGYGTGSMNLTRLTQPAGLSCP